MSSKRALSAAFLAAMDAAISKLQPDLKFVNKRPIAVVEGTFALSGPEGQFDQFTVRIEVGPDYPSAEPIVIETGGRIPRTRERHINPNGSCCLGVWEQWLAEARDTSFAAFLGGPVRDFFLSQSFFEQTNQWPFEERAHGVKGMLEAYAEVLAVKPERDLVCSWLTVLIKPKPTLQNSCPCGSGRTIQHCHLEDVMALRKRVPSRLAEQMLSNLRLYDLEGQRNRMRLVAMIDAALPSRLVPPHMIIAASQSALKRSTCLASV